MEGVNIDTSSIRLLCGPAYKATIGRSKIIKLVKQISNISQHLRWTYAGPKVKQTAGPLEDWTPTNSGV